MPIYLIKRYHKILPTGGDVWYLGREVAFEASDEAQAIAYAKESEAGEVAPYGRLVVVLDLAGKCLLEACFDRHLKASMPSSGAGGRMSALEQKRAFVGECGRGASCRAAA